jgi:hypothetical protein
MYTYVCVCRVCIMYVCIHTCRVCVNICFLLSMDSLHCVYLKQKESYFWRPTLKRKWNYMMSGVSLGISPVGSEVGQCWGQESGAGDRVGRGHVAPRFFFL